uniref:CUB-like domain-containing protein n=1 Tax=Panagrolaimus sp. PS1159 TaxID=55785 RepID=A0AC35GD28_9BILA
MCTGIHTFFNTTYGNSSQTLLHFETDILYSGTPAGYETLTLANQRYFSYNSSYTVYGIQQESYPQQEDFNCANATGNCKLIFADGNGDFNLGVKIGPKEDFLMMVDVAYFRGTVFWEIGLVLTPDNGCVETIDIDFNFPPNYNTNGQYCCNRWETLPDPPPADNTCQEFTSTIEYYNSSMSLANLTFQYYFDTGKNITVIGKNFTSPLPFLTYDHNINYAFQDCQGTLQNPVAACVAPMEFGDAVYAFYADITGYTAATWHGISGAVEYRYGQLMRNASDPFTPQNSCFQYSFDASIGGSKAFDKTVKSRSNFCCTKWKNPVPSTTPSPTTTKKPSGGTKYAVSLQVANSTNFNADTLATLNATLQVTSTHYAFDVTSYTSFVKSNYHVYIFANEFLTEDCIGSSKKNCNLKQTDGQSYPWFLSTSFAPDGFRLFSTTAKNGALIIPELSPSNERCYFVVNPYNYAYPALYVQASICLQ